MPTNTNSPYNDLLRSAKKRPEFANVLEAVFSHPVVGRALLISHSELFEPIRIKDGKVPFQFRARGLPYLSHRFDSLFSSACDHAAFLEQAFKEKERAIIKPIQQLQESTGSELWDRLSLASLATLQKNPALLELANRTEPVDITQLRQAVRDYSGVDVSAFQSLFVDALPMFFQRSTQRKAINRLTMNLDSLFHVSNPDGARREMVWRTVARFIELLKTRRVSETQWRSIITDLAQADLLEASSSIYLWCRRCPEVGVTVPTTLTKCALPPLCPSCGKEAHTISTLVPAGPLQDAVFTPDGLLGVAVAWHLKKHHFCFEAAKHTGTTEFDFVVTTKRGPILLECKMLHVLSANITSNLWSSRNQLRDHIEETGKQGIRLYKAVCIVNIPARELRSLLQNFSEEAAMEFRNIEGEVISYEHFPKWLEFQVGAIKGGEK